MGEMKIVFCTLVVFICRVSFRDSIYEPPHDKTNKTAYAPSKDSDQPGHPLQSSLCAQWVAKDPIFLHAISEDSDQTVRVPRLI